jgi:hypothetical protein
MAKLAIISHNTSAQLSGLDLAIFATRRLPTSLTVSTALTELHRQHHADYQGQPDQSHDETHDVAPAGR